MMNNSLFGQPMNPQQMPPMAGNPYMPVNLPQTQPPVNVVANQYGQPQSQPSVTPQAQQPTYVGDPTLDRYIHMFIGANESSLQSSPMIGGA